MYKTAHIRGDQALVGGIYDETERVKGPTLGGRNASPRCRCISVRARRLEQRYQAPMGSCPLGRESRKSRHTSSWRSSRVQVPRGPRKDA